jgi:gluconokinase
MIVIVAGVSVSGKTTVGGLLAERLGWLFADDNSFHPAANLDKMTREFLLPMTIAGHGWPRSASGWTRGLPLEAREL